MRRYGWASTILEPVKGAGSALTKGKSIARRRMTGIEGGLNLIVSIRETESDQETDLQNIRQFGNSNNQELIMNSKTHG